MAQSNALVRAAALGRGIDRDKFDKLMDILSADGPTRTVEIDEAPEGDRYGARAVPPDIRYSAHGNGGGCDCRDMGGGGGLPVNAVGSPFSTGEGWGPARGSCPENVGRWLMWLGNSFCSYNRFGQVDAVILTAEAITLPDPLGSAGFAIGLSQGQQTLGVYFPADWCAEAVGHAITRIRLSFAITIAHSPSLTPSSIAGALYERCTLSIVQVGTSDPWTNAARLGIAEDAAPSSFLPSLGGYFFKVKRPFYPFALMPEIDAIALDGIGPGSASTDQYSVGFTSVVYFKEVV